MRVKFQDLYKMYYGKWVVTINSEWKNGSIDTCEVFGVYDTMDEAGEASDHLLQCGLFKMTDEEEEGIGYIFIAAC